MDWRAGREQGAALRRLSGIIRWRDKRDVVDEELRTDLAGPYGVSPGVLWLRAAFRRSMEGRSIPPSGIIHRGGQKRHSGLESETKLAELATCKQGALGTLGRIPLFEAGMLRYPSGMLRWGGKIDAGNERRGEGGLLDLTEA